MLIKVRVSVTVHHTVIVIVAEVSTLPSAF